MTSRGVVKAPVIAPAATNETPLTIMFCLQVVIRFGKNIPYKELTRQLLRYERVVEPISEDNGAA